MQSTCNKSKLQLTAECHPNSWVLWWLSLNSEDFKSVAARFSRVKDIYGMSLTRLADRDSLKILSKENQKEETMFYQVEQFWSIEVKSLSRKWTISSKNDRLCIIEMWKIALDCSLDFYKVRVMLDNRHYHIVNSHFSYEV